VSYKKDFKKMQDTAFLGATTLQATSLLSGTNPVSTIPGFVGIGIAGATANISNRMITGNFNKKRKRR
jgi:hypothetical protein